MILATEIKCEKCGNADPNLFETVEGEYSAPRRDGWRGANVLKGARCKLCGTVEHLPPVSAL